MINKQKLREATDHNQGEAAFPGWKNMLTLTAMGIGLVLLWLTSRVSYLLFHSLVEAFSVLVAWGIFIVAWNTRRYTAHGYFLFLGVASLGVGAIDLVHLLAYKGMGVFPGATADLPTQLWIAGRYLQGVSLLLAPLFLTRQARGTWLLPAYFLATALLLAAVFSGWFPVCFVEGRGLTPFKVASEYVIAVLLAAGFFFVYRRRQHLDRWVLQMVLAAIGLHIAAGMAFTLYVDVYGLFNQFGHILKTMAFVMLYQGVVAAGLRAPTRTLFRELAQSEDRYRMLFDTMTEGFALHEIIVDEEGRPSDYRFLEVNAAFERLTGLRRNGLLGRRVLEVLPDTEPYWIETYGRVALEGTPSHFERFFPPLQRWFQVIAYRSHPGRFAVIFTDISERKRAEEALRLSQEHSRILANMLELSDQPFAVDYPDKSIGYLNKAFEDLTGYSRAELQRIDWPRTLTPPEWREVEASHLRELQRTGEPVRYEKEYFRQDGSRVPVELLVHLMKDEQGHPKYYYSFITDLTDRKRYEETLRTSRAAALNLTEDAIDARRKAEQISADLEKASEQLKRDNREVALYNRILKEFIEKSGYDVFAPVLDIILEEMASRHGVFGYIPEPGHLICPSLSAMLEECEIEGKCIHYPPEKWKGLWARALREKRSFLSNQPAAVPRGHVPIRNNLAVPILYRGEAIGLLNLANKETDFTEKDRDLLEATAGRIAPVLYAWIQHRLREEERQQAEADLQRAHGELEQRVRERTRVLKTTVEALEAEIVRRRELEETLRASEQQVRFFASQYLAAQEQERKRIAGELHDSLASTLVAAKYRLEKMAREMEAGLDPGGTLEEVITILSGLNKEVRRIMVDLRPAVLDDLGLLPALNWLCREFEKTYGHIRVEKQTELAENELAETLKTPIFRLTQEALNNVAKHSGASRVTFSLSKADGRIVLIIRDNGRGFEPLAVVRGLGLTTMKERTELSGGEYRLQSACGQGTVLFASWPLGDCI